MATDETVSFKVEREKSIDAKCEIFPTCVAGFSSHYRPVEPKPPAPLSELDNSAASS